MISKKTFVGQLVKRMRRFTCGGKKKRMKKKIFPRMAWGTIVSELRLVLRSSKKVVVPRWSFLFLEKSKVLQLSWYYILTIVPKIKIDAS